MRVLKSLDFCLVHHLCKNICQKNIRNMMLHKFQILHKQWKIARTPNWQTRVLPWVR